ncbi:hypothetical protein [Halovenus salina]|uniref:HEAT repeat-containing protein n=1 Tax=Halovenus salina TaxID=1510225 RepID=A0ABD5VYS2_9EURY|nr:hypothetical protein [Halovenus salina]
MSVEFQTAIKKSVARENRSSAVDRLAAKDERANLSVLVQAGGLAGEFRRQALKGLINCGGTEQLKSLADDPSVPKSLRRRAEEAV